MRSLTLTSAAVMAITGDTRNVSDVDESRVIKATMHTPVAFWRPTRLRSSASTTRSDHSVPSTIPPATVLESRLAVCPSWVRQQLEDVAGLIGEVPEHAKAEFRRVNIGFVLHPVHDEGTAPVPARRGRGRLPAPRVQSPRHITYCRLLSPSIRTERSRRCTDDRFPDLCDRFARTDKFRNGGRRPGFVTACGEPRVEARRHNHGRKVQSLAPSSP